MLFDYTELFGFFDFEDIYDMAIEIAPNDSIFVELGSYFGKSACYLAQKVQESKKKITLYVVDMWELIGGEEKHKKYRDSIDPDMYFVFLETMRRASILSNIVPIKMDSSKSSRLFNDSSVFFCYIDANHTYNSVLQDIKSWLPKIKSGGILAGHDYLNNGITEPKYEGLERAVNEMFPDGIERIGNRSWLKRI